MGTQKRSTVLISKKVLIPVLTLSIASLLLVNSSSSFGEEGSRNKEQENNSRTFSPIGTRSHGEPTREWSANLSTPSTMSINSPSVSTDQPNADDAWVADNFTRNPIAIKAATVGSAITKSPITCRGTCQMLTGSTNKSIIIIPVWVGTWTDANKTQWNTVLGNLVNTFSNTRTDHVLSTNKQYFTLKNQTLPSITWSTTPKPAIALKSPTATAVSDADVATYINSYITANPLTTSGVTPIYVYMGGSNTRLSSGFGTKYCGWHSYGNTDTGQQTFIAIQDFTSTYFGACSAQSVSPNGNIPLDAMASVLIHEIDETITDPFLNAWYDNKGAENADKCAWTFGTSSTLSGYKFNVIAGTTKYYIQQNWLADNLVTASGAAAGTACSILGK